MNSNKISTAKVNRPNIPTLKEYVLIEQDIATVRVMRKSDQWRTSSYFLGDEVYFESIDFTLSVKDIYSRVDNQDVREFLNVDEYHYQFLLIHNDTNPIQI